MVASAVCASAGTSGCSRRNARSRPLPVPSGRLTSISQRSWRRSRARSSAEERESAQSTVAGRLSRTACKNPRLIGSSSTSSRRGWGSWRVAMFMLPPCQRCRVLICRAQRGLPVFVGRDNCCADRRGLRRSHLRQYAPFLPAACRHVARTRNRLDRTPFQTAVTDLSHDGRGSPAATARAARSPSSAAPCRASWCAPNLPPVAGISMRPRPWGAGGIAAAGHPALPALWRLRRLCVAASGGIAADRGQTARTDG